MRSILREEAGLLVADQRKGFGHGDLEVTLELDVDCGSSWRIGCLDEVDCVLCKETENGESIFSYIYTLFSLHAGVGGGRV